MQDHTLHESGPGSRGNARSEADVCLLENMLPGETEAASPGKALGMSQENTAIIMLQSSMIICCQHPQNQHCRGIVLALLGWIKRLRRAGASNASKPTLPLRLYLNLVQMWLMLNCCANR